MGAEHRRRAAACPRNDDGLASRERGVRIASESEDAIRLYGKLGATAEWHSRTWELVIPRAG